MAVEKTSIYTFFGRYKRISAALVILLQLIATIIFALAIVVSGVLDHNDLLFWVLVLIALATNIAMGIVILTIALEPMRAISRALSQVAGESSPEESPPPNSNDRRYKASGAKEMIDLIYTFTPPPEQMPPTVAELIDAALQTSSSSIVILNQKGVITYASKHAPVRQTIKGGLELDLSFDNQDTTIHEWLKECHKKAINSEHLWRRVAIDPDSQHPHRMYDIAASFSRDTEAEVILVLHDRTHLYEPEENDLDFIAFAAHELRGPITVIRGYLDVFEDELNDVLTNDQKALLGRLVVSANRLSTYVNNILNVSRYDRRHYRIELSEQHIDDIYNSIAEDMETRALAQDRRLTINIPKDLPTVAADPSSVAEVFTNLLDNAIKYSNENGLIEVTSQVSGDFVDTTVVDHGIGMPDTVVRNLFHKFYRSHRSRESVAGSGIGLYISKAIIESHGGNISVRSSEDKGSTFTFSLPIYATVEEKLKNSDNGNNEGVIQTGKNWISNHNMYRG